MRDFTIMTDSSCDLPADIIEKYDIKVVPMSVTFDSVPYKHYHDYRELPMRELYDGMLAGKTGSTAGTNIIDAIEIIRPELEAERDIIFLSISSGLSCSYQNVCLAADELREEYPDTRIEVIDTKSVSLGVGLMVYIAAASKEMGDSFDVVVDYLRSECPNVSHYFTVDDLSYIQKSGRISHLSSVVGTVLNVKPIFTIGNDGKVKSDIKVRGRKAALSNIVNKAIESCDDPTIFGVVHADSWADAKNVKEMLREKYPEAKIIIGDIGPIIGVNVGVGALAVIGLGNGR